MLSRVAIGVSQPGQCERGFTIDSCRGTRQITTLRNDPTTSPYTPATTVMNSVTTEQRRHALNPNCTMLTRYQASRYQVAAQLGSPAAGAPLALQLAPGPVAYFTPAPAVLSSSDKK